jgi:ADP-ribose pyrophosphatase
MRAIVIADGLTKDFLSLEQPFVEARNNLGRAEIDRLLGRGKGYGEGPLSAFLQAIATAANSKQGAPDLVLLRSDNPLPEILEEAVASARVIESDPERIPQDELEEAIPDARGIGADLRTLVIGCHTERRILALTSYLKKILGFPEVAVSPHLVGSATREAHLAALRHNFPSIGVRVLLDLSEAASFVGLDSSTLSLPDCRPPDIGPAQTRDSLTDSQRRILELLCLNWTRAEMRPLAGGFSGSLLLLANGWKGEAHTEPQVIKVDAFSQMRRELSGYHQVKDFFGKHVPTFGYPVMDEDSIGVGMELAAMEGNPRTLQDSFEEADSDEALGRFLIRLDKSLDLLSDKLYRNTQETGWVVPYRVFGLHTEEQVQWLVQNANHILSYLEGELPPEGRIDSEQLAKLLRLITANHDGVDSETCLVHGDLNFANVICDEIDNIWFIDWTHSGQAPIELDFAKLENDAKFVMSKAFDATDLPRLRLLEEYLLEQRLPADPNSLPERLKFAKWDLRYRRILETVRRVRQACYELKGEAEDWLVYRIALLRYATHTLSFDKRRDRGECGPVQLMHALYSVEALIYNLVADDFHLKIRAERPSSYPPRQRISIDESPWILDCEGYDPPYHVDNSVLKSDRTRAEGGWADPEDFRQVIQEPRISEVRFHADDGRPLNPRGRTGLAGRGLLGLWGVNLSVATLVVRRNPDAGHLEVMLGGWEESRDLEVVKGFVLPGESEEHALRRVLTAEAGWDPGPTRTSLIFEGYTYDPRQTDNAWVESQAFMVLPEDVPTLLSPGAEFDEIKWWPLDADTVNRLPSDQASFIRKGVARLVETGLLDEVGGEEFLASTG